MKNILKCLILLQVLFTSISATAADVSQVIDDVHKGLDRVPDGGDPANICITKFTVVSRQINANDQQFFINIDYVRGHVKMDAAIVDKPYSVDENDDLIKIKEAIRSKLLSRACPVGNSKQRQVTYENDFSKVTPGRSVNSTRATFDLR